MRVLLDECLPKGLKNLLPGYDVATVPEMGWAGMENGALLEKAGSDFDVFLTIDKNIPAQQNPEKLPIQVFILWSMRNRLEDLSPLMPIVLEHLDTPEQGRLIHIRHPTNRSTLSHPAVTNLFQQTSRFMVI